MASPAAGRRPVLPASASTAAEAFSFPIPPFKQIGRHLSCGILKVGISWQWIGRDVELGSVRRLTAEFEQLHFAVFGSRVLVIGALRLEGRSGHGIECVANV